MEEDDPSKVVIKIEDPAKKKINSNNTKIDVVDVSYCIKGGKQILHNINTSFVSGELYCLMGSSGAGKTTLLNVLAGRAMHQKFGDILINNESLNKKSMRMCMNFVPQDDILISCLTCKQTLMWAAKLRLPSSMSSAEREAKVDSILKTLKLWTCRDVIVGDENLKGLSGGQKKRVSIALELLTAPTILFLDEPTSGLDSSSAEDLVELLKELARTNNQIIITTIHQPSFEVFKKFNTLLLLDKGQIVFNDKVSKTQEYLEYLNNPPPEFSNPIDHFLKILNNSVPLDNFKSYSEAYLQSLNTAKAENDDSRQSKHVSLESYDSSLMSSSFEYPTTWLEQFWILFQRKLTISLKDKSDVLTMVISTTFIIGLIGSIYFQLPNTQNTMQDRQSVLFILIVFTGMRTVMTTVLTVPIEKAVLAREYQNGYYSIGAFYCSRMTVALLLQTFYSIYSAVLVYSLVGLYDDFGHFLVFAAAMTSIGFIGACLGFMVGALMPNAQSAANFTPLIILPLTMFSGLLVQPANIPIYYRWMYYLSFFQYAFQIMVVNDFKDRVFEPCSPEQLFTAACPLGQCNGDAFNASLPAMGCSGQLMIDRLDYDADDTVVNFAILVGMFLTLLVAGFFAIGKVARRLI